MVDYADSSQLNLWLFSSPLQLDSLRARANYRAREFLQKQSGEEDKPANLLVESFACGFRKRVLNGEEEEEKYEEGPWQNEKGNEFLTPAEEATLVSFYASRLPNLIGPKASVPRLHRDPKVTATAALLFRRFFLSNSVMIHDPKAVMVAAAFLGSKAEDATADIRYLEEGTQVMNAPVTQQEIIPSEISLLTGIHFDLLCFHPYKAVLALTQDLRTHLKSDKGRSLVDRPVSGQDLRPMHEAARQLVDDCVVSDIPLLYNPGQIGIAALMVAQENLLLSQQQQAIPKIDLQGYMKQRFATQASDDDLRVLHELCEMLRALKEGKYGCGHYKVDMSALKHIHKKLKKVRVWGNKEKKKKRDREEQPKDEPPSKRVKT